jgi:uncharacterized protein
MTEGAVHTDIRVKVTPRSAKNHILGRDGEPYRVKVTAPPVEGLANKALIALLSERLGIAKRNIEITSGKGSRLKKVRIQGLTEAEIAKALEA